MVCVCWKFVVFGTLFFSKQTVTGDICESLAIRSSQLISQIHSQLKDTVRIYCSKGQNDEFERIYADDSDAELLRKLDVNVPIKITTHGYNHNNDTWLIHAAQKWAKLGNNGCYLYYAQIGTTPPYSYFQIAKIILPIIAEYVVDLLDHLRSLGFPLAETELAGHSLGCQLMGQIARVIVSRDANHTLKRVFGLDCAQPCFTFPEIVENRTKADVARIVQCLHTSFFFGQVVPCGCQDVYIDSIMVVKCPLPRNVTETTLTRLANCNHAFSFEIFEATMALDQQCYANNFFSIMLPFLGRDQDQLRVGIHCETGCRNSAMYYMVTNNSPPYCPKK